MNLEQMRKIAGERTKGEWGENYHSDHFQFPEIETFAAGPRHRHRFNCTEDALVKIAQAKCDAEFIAMAANHFDKMLDVVEAAKAYYTLDLQQGLDFPPWFKSYNRVKEALKALEEE